MQPLFRSLPERSTALLSLPRTHNSSTIFLATSLVSGCSMPWYPTASGACIIPADATLKFMADAYHDVSRKDCFFILRQTLLGSISRPCTLTDSSGLHDKTASTSLASMSSPTLGASRASRIMRCSVAVFPRTWISSSISCAVNGQKVRSHTPRSSPQPFSALTASLKKPSLTCLALAPIAMSFSRSPSSWSSFFVKLMPSVTSSEASAQRPSLTLSRAALWQPMAR
mmetsp:Transcript_79663/g.215731  ORF Transcript_79663/g.215731 Transcript_79663/m.215731 type:complete len:227 (-) Transcript_79663:763-1443(-)